MENLLLRIAEHFTLVDAYMKEYNATMWGQPGSIVQRTYPHVAAVSIAVEFLRIKTSGEEREIADEISETWNAVAHATVDNTPSACGILVSAISKWRLGAPRESITDTLETARQLSLRDGEIEVRPDDES